MSTPWSAKSATNRSSIQKGFKTHIDKEHFASIEEKNGHITVVCVLCQGVSGDLEGHKQNLSEKHPYVKITTIDKSANDNSLSYTQKQAPSSPSRNPPHIFSRSIKGKLQQLDSTSRFKITRTISPAQCLIEYQSREYYMHKLSKQYNGMQYDQSQIIPQLVYFPVFTVYRATARLFVLEKFPLQKTIQCNSYIICEKS